MLNRFFEIVVAAVDDRQGLINKFEGDAALAVFGAPLPSADPESDALATARVLAARLRGLPMVDFGIGVSAGPVFAGNIGAEHRYEYTVIGDAVNEAARLADRAKSTRSARCARWRRCWPPARASRAVDRMRFRRPCAAAWSRRGWRRPPAGAFPPFPCAPPVVGMVEPHPIGALRAPGGTSWPTRRTLPRRGANRLRRRRSRGDPQCRSGRPVRRRQDHPRRGTAGGLGCAVAGGFGRGRKHRV